MPFNSHFLTMEELKKQIKQQFPTWQEFVKEQDPAQLIINYDSITRLSDIYDATPVTLQLIHEIYPLKNNSAGMNYLCAWLAFLNDFLNINKGIQQKYLNHLAYSLYAKYRYFKLADLKLLLDFILESRYGTFYGSIDTQRIVSSFFEYSRERNETFRKIDERIEEERKKQERETAEYHPVDFSKFTNLTKLFK